MKFERDKLKTVLEVDEVSVGDEGYFTNCLLEMKEVVENNELTYYGKIIELDINGNEDNCFRSSIDNSYNFYFYLVKRGIDV